MLARNGQLLGILAVRQVVIIEEGLVGGLAAVETAVDQNALRSKTGCSGGDAGDVEVGGGGPGGSSVG